MATDTEYQTLGCSVETPEVKQDYAEVDLRPRAREMKAGMDNERQKRRDSRRGPHPVQNAPSYQRIRCGLATRNFHQMEKSGLDFP